jgi:hypothetical protein
MGIKKCFSGFSSTGKRIVNMVEVRHVVISDSSKDAEVDPNSNSYCGHCNSQCFGCNYDL